MVVPERDGNAGNDLVLIAKWGRAVDYAVGVGTDTLTLTQSITQPVDMSAAPRGSTASTAGCW